MLQRPDVPFCACPDVVRVCVQVLYVNSTVSYRTGIELLRYAVVVVVVAVAVARRSIRHIFQAKQVISFLIVFGVYNLHRTVRKT